MYEQFPLHNFTSILTSPESCDPGPTRRARVWLQNIPNHRSSQFAPEACIDQLSLPSPSQASKHQAQQKSRGTHTHTHAHPDLIHVFGRFKRLITAPVSVAGATLVVPRHYCSTAAYGGLLVVFHIIPKPLPSEAVIRSRPFLRDAGGVVFCGRRCALCSVLGKKEETVARIRGQGLVSPFCTKPALHY